MGIFDWIRREPKEPASVSELRRAAPVDNAIARLSNASDEERVGLALELLKSSGYEGRAAVASEVARLEIKAVGVWYELANALADDSESVRLASANAFWQLDGVDYAIRSLRDEHEAPAHMTRKQALEGIEVLLKTADDKSVFKALLRDNWQDYPQLDVLEKGTAERVCENEQPDKQRTTPMCAKCNNSFTWEESYVTKKTPNWSQLSHLGFGDNRPRLFCPKCGSLVVDWHMTEDFDFDEWIWYGDNKAANLGVPLPPDPVYSEVGKIMPPDLRPTFSNPVLDITKMKEWQKILAAREKARKESQEKPLNVQELTAKVDVDGLIDALHGQECNWPHSKYRAVVKALVGIGAPAVESLIAAFKSAESMKDGHTDLDQNLRGGVAEALGIIGDSRGVESLICALVDYRPFIRTNAARALKKIDNAVITSEASKVRAPALIDKLRNWSKSDYDFEVAEVAKSLLKVIPGSSS